MAKTFLDRFSDFRKDERVPKIVGLLLILLSFILLIAFLSYLATWKIDQDKVFQFSWRLLGNSEVEVANKLGRFGAIISHTFFYDLFGLPSFVFVFLSFVYGISLLLKRSVLKLRSAFLHSLFILIYLSSSLNFVSSLLDLSDFAWGGALGSAINYWLSAFLGDLGNGILLIFTLLIYLVVVFNLDIPIHLPTWFKKEEGEEEDDDGFQPVIDRSGEIEDVQEEGSEEETIEEELDNEISNEEELEDGAPGEEGKIDLDIEETKEEALVDRNTVQMNYDPTLDLPNYKYPTLDLLEDYGADKIEVNQQELEKNKDQIIATLENYNIKIAKIKATIGPTVTLYEIVPAPGIRISKIKNLEDDIALSLSALGIRIIAPIPGKGTIGIEVPNIKKEIVPMRTLLSSEKYQNAKMDLPIALGKSISNEIYVTDLAKMPHLLIAGATGQGKSVGLNAIITSLIYKKHPSQIKFVLIDPKKVELSLYRSIEKHFLARLPGEEDAITTDTKKVIHTVKALCIELDERYNLLKAAHVRNIKEYNEKFVGRKLNPEKGHRFLPYIVLVVDEFADLIMTAGKEIETPITRLAQLARAIGIHLVIATQRPSVNIITGTIKANFPARIAYKVTAKVDSRTILDTGGAEQLIGRGDMLLASGSELIRLQCGFVDTPEVENITEFIGNQKGFPEIFLLPEYVDEKEIAEGFDVDEKDEFFADAAHIVVQNQQGSTSLIQRRLKLGYNRAGRIIDQLEAAGIVGPSEGSKAREVLFSDLELEQYLRQLDEPSDQEDI